MNESLGQATQEMSQPVTEAAESTAGSLMEASQSEQQGKFKRWKMSRNDRAASKLGDVKEDDWTAQGYFNQEGVDTSKDSLFKDSMASKLKGGQKSLIRSVPQFLRKKTDKFDNMLEKDNEEMGRAQELMKTVAEKYRLLNFFSPQNLALGSLHESVKDATNGTPDPNIDVLTSAKSVSESTGGTDEEETTESTTAKDPVKDVAEVQSIEATEEKEEKEEEKEEKEEEKAAPAPAPAEEQSQEPDMSGWSEEDKKAYEEHMLQYQSVKDVAAKDPKEKALKTAKDLNKASTAIKIGGTVARSGVKAGNSIAEFADPSLADDTEHGQLINQITGNVRGVTEIGAGSTKLASQAINYHYKKQDMDKRDKTAAALDMMDTVGGIGMGATRLGLVNSGSDAHSANGNNQAANDMHLASATTAKNILSIGTDSARIGITQNRISNMKKLAKKGNKSKQDVGIKRSKEEKKAGVTRLDKAEESRNAVREEALKQYASLPAEEAKKKADEAVEQKRKEQANQLEKDLMHKTAITARKEQRNKAMMGLGKSLVSLGLNITRNVMAVGGDKEGAALFKKINKYAGMAMDFVGDKILEKINEKQDVNIINQMIDMIKIQGGERASILNDIKNYDDIKKKFRVGYAIVSKGEPDAVRNLSDMDFKTVMSVAISGEAGGKKGLVNSVAKKSASDIVSKKYDSEDDRAFFEEAGIVKNDGKLPSEAVLQQRMGMRELEDGTYEGNETNASLKPELEAKKVDKVKRAQKKELEEKMAALVKKNSPTPVAPSAKPEAKPEGKETLPPQAPPEK